ncbi:MAG: HNH endonuclease [Spirirestis rafaelensis WJT71-NPBG6]|jgi:hypothetical protein|nr:HNH endonuclease [Spirirestis rafaelensis WJT71-NPBG6]
MKKCIICKTDKLINEFTKEHIFPESIGGTLTLNVVCKKCNDFLGHSVDSHLVNHSLVQLACLSLKIGGKKAKVPNPLERGTLADNPNKEVKYICDESGNSIKLDIVTKFQGDIIKDGRVNITVDNKNQNQLPSMINKMLKRKGVNELSEEKIYQHAIKSNNPCPWVDVNLKVDLINYQRAILKIAYELAYYWLGDAYLNDKVGEVLRCCIKDECLKEDWYQKYPTIKANIGFFGDNSSSFLENIWGNELNSHIALLIPNQQETLCYVKIFNTFQGVIVVSENSPFSYDLLESDSPGKFIAINSQTGEKRESSLCEEIKRTNK